LASWRFIRRGRSIHGRALRLDLHARKSRRLQKPRLHANGQSQDQEQGRLAKDNDSTGTDTFNHNKAADTLLVIEAADASLAYDLDTKPRLYQKAGIANDWVVDVRDPMAFFLLQGQNDLLFLAELRKPVEALVAELRALG
jgi:hypothetical protein